MKMRKVLLTVLSMMTMMHLHAQQNMELTASEVAQRMMPGWNLGNTLEAGKSLEVVTTFSNKGGMESETAWQPTKTTQAIIDYVKSLGFRSVRIPCAWVLGHISDASNYTIDATWMARVKEIVDYCIKDDLYVLLNDHWDGGWLEENIAATGAQKDKNKAVLKAIWTQIANEFRDYDDHLVFGGLNEPAVNKESDVSALVEYHQTFIDAVRATGGNNKKRLLVVQGPSTDAEKTCKWLADKMPKDPIGNKLAVEVHLYYPWNFWAMDKDESWGNMFYYWGKDNHVSESKHNATFGEEKDMTAIADLLKEKFVDKGYPVINGEYGVNWRTITGPGESQEKHNASIKYYYKFMNQMCMERGIVPIVWDINYTSGTNTMTLIDRQNQTVYNHYMMDGIHEAMKAMGLPIPGDNNNLFTSLLGKSQVEVDARINSIWTHFFTPGDLNRYEADGEQAVYYEVGDSMAIILDTGSNDVRTEGMSYGMMISLQLNKRTEFDKLWRWAKTYMAYPEDSPWDGYFCWQCGLDGTQIGTSNASDGEIYFVTALFMAAEKWNEPRYAEEANTILQKVSSKDGPKTGVYNLYDDSTRLVTFVPNEEVHWYSDPSYCLPAFLDLWAKKAATNNDFWREAADKARWLLKVSQDPVTGLYPDYCLFDGKPYRRPNFQYNTDRYQYDAIRCAMNVGMDYYLTGKDADNQRVMMRRLLQFFKNDGFRHGQFNLDGSEPTDGYTEGMAGANAVGAFTLADSNNEEDLALAREYVQRLWDVKPPTGKWRYYVGMVYFLSMLHVSGHFS